MSPPTAPAQDFPYSLTINTPFPTRRLAYIALRALSVDAELSPLVNRSFSLGLSSKSSSSATTTTNKTALEEEQEDPAKSMKVSPLTGGALHHLEYDHSLAPQTADDASPGRNPQNSTLITTYSATTNRMLRVSVNGFFESLGVVLACMRELDGEDGWRGSWIGEPRDGEGQGSDVAELRRVQGLMEEGEGEGVIGGA